MYPSSIAPITILVEDRSVVVDRRGPLLLLEAADRRVRDGEPGGVAEHRDVLVHRVTELGLDLRDAAAAARGRGP